MLLNRRTMLQAGIGIVALGLSGCKNTKTTVVFINNLTTALSVNAQSNGLKFKKNNIQPGSFAKSNYRSNAASGTVTDVTGTVTPAGFPPVDLGAFFLTVTLGFTNTYSVSLDPLTSAVLVSAIVS